MRSSFLAIPDTAQQDATFIANAIHSSMLAMEMAKAALLGGGAPDILLDLSQRILDRHVRLDDDLRTIARTHGADAPITLTSDIYRKVIDLCKSRGSEFIELYLLRQIDCHVGMIEAFEEEQVCSKEADLRFLTLRHLSHLRSLLEDAKDLDAIF